MRFITRPTVTAIEAFQWTGNNLDEVKAFVGEHQVGPIERRPDYPLRIRNRHTTAWQEVPREHWIVKGEAEEGCFTFYAPVAFEQAYQSAEDAEKSMGWYHGTGGNYTAPLELLPPDWMENIEAANQAMRDLGCQITVTQRAFQKAGLSWPVPDTTNQTDEPTTQV